MDLNAKKINESLEKAEDTELKPWYRTNKYGDWILDHIAYGWRVYYKYYDVKRWIISTYQRMRYGVSDSECWSLDWTLTNFILPRLKHFKKINVHTHPPQVTPEQWDKILDELIWCVTIIPILGMVFPVTRGAAIPPEINCGSCSCNITVKFIVLCSCSCGVDK